MTRTFRADVLEDAFARDGYVVLPFLRPEQITELRALFDRLYPARRADFECTALNQVEDDQHHAAHEALAPWFAARLADLFEDHYVVKGFFTCKWGGLPPDNQSMVVLHQDLTSSDEPAVRAPVVWSPLTDVDLDNGCLEVVPGSHRFVDAHRGANMAWAFRDVEDGLRANLRALPMRAGEMVVYDSGLIHCSARNTTPHDRPVVGFGLARRGHRLIHLHAPDDGRLDTYEVEPDFYRRHPHHTTPERWLLSKESQPLVDHRVSPEELEALVEAYAAGHRT